VAARAGFWLPGGAVDPRESLCAAAVRETKEEAGAGPLPILLRIRKTAMDKTLMDKTVMDKTIMEIAENALPCSVRVCRRAI
jgi:8-oxo-dGTP pyrophosphatase MutT (NUDIX family)